MLEELSQWLPTTNRFRRGRQAAAAGRGRAAVVGRGRAHRAAEGAGRGLALLFPCVSVWGPTLSSARSPSALRVKAGQARARKQGKRIGRSEGYQTSKVAKALPMVRRLRAEGVSIRGIAAATGLAPNTVLKLVKPGQ